MEGNLHYKILKISYGLEEGMPVGLSRRGQGIVLLVFAGISELVYSKGVLEGLFVTIVEDVASLDDLPNNHHSI